MWGSVKRGGEDHAFDELKNISTPVFLVPYQEFQKDFRELPYTVHF